MNDSILKLREWQYKLKNLDCYDEILSYYNSEQRSTLNDDRWIGRYLKRLMNGSSIHHNAMEVSNSLMLISLLIMNDDFDHYNSVGKSFEELNQREKRRAVDQLRSLKLL